MHPISSHRASKLASLALSIGTLGLGGALGLTSTSCALEDISDIPEFVQGKCVYVNRFSNREECREYLGEAWDEGVASEDCQDAKGEFEWGAACNYESTLGRCIMNAEDDDVYAIQMPGDDEADCASSKRGCQFFGGGVFDPSPVCGGNPEDPGIPSDEAFQAGELICVPPMDGEPQGVNDDGEVCTREDIHSCTEAGRKFADYASCDPIYTQRPYGPANPATDEFDPDDPRLADDEYMAELAWVTEQVEACACVCCHSSELAPDGPSNWYIEASPLWVDTFYPSGLAMMAGWIDSSSFGAFPPEENNGFSRENGMPSTDEERMTAFFANELQRLGYTQADFGDNEPFGGPLYEQLIYEPGRCENGEGVQDGVITWEGSPARLVYVLEADAANPTVPPNLDLPEGTLWNIIVPWTGDPIKSGIRYGDIPEGWTQRIPESGGEPPALEAGKDYYLYVLADYIIPTTRCIFTAQ